MRIVEVLSTENVDLDNRPEFWRATLYEKFGLESRVDQNPNFNAKIESGKWSEVGLFRLSAAGYYVRRTEHSRYRSRYVKIAYQIQGESYFDQNGRCVRLAPGEWTVYDDSLPYVSSNPEYVQLLIVTIPRQRILSRSIDLSKTMGVRFAGDKGIAKLTFGFILNTFDQSSDVPQAFAPDLMDIMSHQLLLCLLDAQGKASAPSATGILRERIKTYVLHNIRNPGLNVEQIATELGCSRRYLYKAFEGEASSIAEYIWNARLARCSETLRLGDQSITDIAYSWGFNSSAHFSTLFKKHFGMTPRDYRSIYIPCAPTGRNALPISPLSN
jgi:AraC-like DNA-binding protein